MKYLNVMKSHDPDTPENIRGFNIAQTGASLFSLVGGLGQKSVGLDTITNEAMKIRKYSQYYKQDKGNKLYADSGGYSILSGVIPKVLIPRVIKTYNRYLQYESSFYDYIFTLDVAYSNKHQDINKKRFIYEMNKVVLQDLVHEIERNPKLMEKVFFVWHFKMPSQYEIFKSLYKEFNLTKYINNYSIGGMVGMRRKNLFHFSPFTPMVYRCLLDCLENDRNVPFRLHFLGMYLEYDRFQIAFFEKMCQRYLSDMNKEVLFSYDSTYFERTARNKNKPFFDLRNPTKIFRYNSVINLPTRIIDDVYEDPETNKFIKTEIDRRRNGFKLLNAHSLGPLGINSNLKLDRFFENIIDEYQMVDVFFKFKTKNAIIKRTTKIIEEIKIKYPHVFTSRMIKSIEENMGLTFKFHNWFMKNRKLDQLDYHTKRFIKETKFGERLT